MPKPLYIRSDTRLSVWILDEAGLPITTTTGVLIAFYDAVKVGADGKPQVLPALFRMDRQANGRYTKDLDYTVFSTWVFQYKTKEVIVEIRAPGIISRQRFQIKEYDGPSAV